MATPTQNTIDTARVSSFAAGSGTGLLFGDKWGPGKAGAGVTLTWSVPQGTAWYDNNYSYYGEWRQWYIFSATEIAGAQKALKAWDLVSNVAFRRVADDAATVGEIRFAKTAYTMPYSDAHGYMPADVPRSGDVWMNIDKWNLNGSDANRPGTYAYFTLLHEIGHALGLKHSFESSIYNNSTVPSTNDHWFFTVMSYTAGPWSSSARPDFFPTTPMYFDLLAIQHLYGRDTTTNTGNNTYTFRDTQKYWQTIHDAGGKDTIVASGSIGSTINLNPGKWNKLGAAIIFTDGMQSRDTVMIGPGVVIENASGGNGADGITGNSSSNTLKGNAGNDTIKGGSGNDILFGGSGNDILAGGSGQDRFYFDKRPSGIDVDRITDFNVKDDTIYLDDAAFGLKKGILSKAAFRLGANAKDTSDRIVYDKATGALYFDPDGIGSAEKIKFATLPKKLALTVADFLVY
ncbi:matrixin family metalloprotease [Microvirga sp. ACRRW]|uniref:M10 family metallopeptidase n=1 Tax=Microvirga sp. ACRRW TaxID=2918205 RepID=UPI001EF6BDBE|nr:M10 family metallopeptidase [Microvirga sp. ACRRW]MCG7392222.1 matrixin family metalloprotease [Microvirga sp. ACRRW]